MKKKRRKRPPIVYTSPHFDQDQGRDIDRRQSQDRKAISELDVLNVKDVDSGEVYFSKASMVDISPTGLLLRIRRGDIIASSLRSALILTPLVQRSVGFTIAMMDTYIEAIITRTKHEGRGVFLVAVDFREDAPEYWRECLVDLIPDDGSA